MVFPPAATVALVPLAVMAISGRLSTSPVFSTLVPLLVIVWVDGCSFSFNGWQ
jgi:hypothetical protein